MLVLISYDITENKIRSRAAKYLLDFGTRVQQSVFECMLTPEQYEEVSEGLRNIINRKEDRVRLYRLCDECGSKMEISGWEEMTEDQEFYIL